MYLVKIQLTPIPAISASLWIQAGHAPNAYRERPSKAGSVKATQICSAIAKIQEKQGEKASCRTGRRDGE
jgi:hypothetical protein